MGSSKCSRSLLCGFIGLALAAPSRAEVVVLSADRSTTDHSHVTYVPGKQPAGTQADQVVETITAAPDFSSFQTSTQTSSLGTNPGGGGLLVTASATGSLLTQPAGPVYKLWESWTYNKTVVTFEVVGQPEEFSFRADDVREAVATLTGESAPLAYSGGEVDTGGVSFSGTLQPGVYTFDVEMQTNDPADFYAQIDPSSSQSLHGLYSNVTFSVTPEPAGLGVVAVALVACSARRRRHAAR